MAVTVSFNGTNYSVPNDRDPKGWGSQLTSYLVALGTALAKSGGNFTLTADVNFGANFGLVAVYYKSASSNIATVGVFRLANNEGMAWRNVANSADLLLKVDSSDDLVYDGNRILDTTDILDEDDMASDSATKVPSQQSVKAYAQADVITTRGDVIIGNSSGTASRLAIGTANQILISDGTDVAWGANPSASAATASTAGIVTSFVPVIKSSVHTVSSADYTVLDSDGYKRILVSTGATDRTITLPTAADNEGREITIIKTDSGAGNLIVDGEGAELINARASTELFGQYAKVTLFCDGTKWYTLEQSSPMNGWTPTTANLGTIASVNVNGQIQNNRLLINGNFDTGTVGAGTGQIGLPPGYTVNVGGTRLVVGYMNRNLSDTTVYRLTLLATDGDAFLTIGLDSSSGVASNPLDNIAVSTFVASSERQVIHASVPITELA